MFRTLGGHLPAPPAFAEPPLLWGTEDHVTDLFDGIGVEIEFARETVDFAHFESIEEELEFTATKFGPMIVARRLLEPQGRWAPLIADLRRLVESRSGPAEYLVITGRKP
jgi:hypothetical protein